MKIHATRSNARMIRLNQRWRRYKRRHLITNIFGGISLTAIIIGGSVLMLAVDDMVRDWRQPDISAEVEKWGPPDHYAELPDGTVCARWNSYDVTGRQGGGILEKCKKVPIFGHW